MSVSFEAYREVQVGAYFGSWLDYLGARCMNQQKKSLDEALRTVNTRDRQLAEQLRKKDPLSYLPYGPLVATARGTPWPTFVLGTGCLGASTSTPDGGAIKSALTAAVAAASDDHDVQRDLERFLDNLTRNRTGQPLESAGLGYANGEERSSEEWAFIARTALAAMLLTELYGEALVHLSQVVSDSHREEIEVPEANHPGWHLHDALVMPLLAALQTLVETEAGDESERASLQSLARSILTAVRDDRRVRRAHVELITAFTWFVLTENTHIYPDWSDLLLFGAFLDSDVADAGAPAWDNPHLKPKTPIQVDGPVARWLTLRLSTITQSSWKSRLEGESPSARAELFDAVAAILLQQAANYAAVTVAPGGIAAYDPPLPTCFVTTFDLELEMAMWQQALADEEPRPFVVVLPVVRAGQNAKSRSDNVTGSVSLGWVWREIVPSRGVDAIEVLRGGDPKEWKLLDRELPPALRDDVAERGSTPIIVRLAGSPLMRVADEVADPTATDNKDAPVLSQALLLDEYTALSQTVLDLTSAVQQSHDKNLFTAGLPASLTDSHLNPEHAYMPRYWMFLGAQLSDSGIRLRLLASQITAAQANLDHGVGDAPLGVAINRRSRPADRDIFHWYGFDVVRHDVVAPGRHSLAAELRDLNGKLAQRFARISAQIDAGAAEWSIE